MEVNINHNWQIFLEDEFNKIYFKDLISFIDKEYATKTCFPEKNKIFEAFNLSTPDDLKVVIIGQDPYHGINQANGLAFSVNNNEKIPPSLKNIFIELAYDLGLEPPINGNLLNWAKQGVLLLNSILTVQENMAGSHKNKGWEVFTNEVIKKISLEKGNLVFLLWGNFAISKEVLIDANKHLILKAVHPSPLSVYRGFFGCKHFSKTNLFLESINRQPINW